MFNNSARFFKFIADSVVVKELFPPPEGENVAMFSKPDVPDFFACQTIKPLYTESLGPTV